MDYIWELPKIRGTFLGPYYSGYYVRVPLVSEYHIDLSLKALRPFRNSRVSGLRLFRAARGH